MAKDEKKAKPDGELLPGKGRAKRLVLLYMAGGATQFETWAPKKKGSPNMGEAEPINTSVEGIEVGSWFPNVAKTMDDICVVRSVTTREGNHDRGRYLMHTGYVPNPTVQHPGVGSYVASEIGDTNSVLPNFVSIGGSQGAGFLGVEWDPFVVHNPAAPVDNLTSPPNIDKRRRDTRLSLLDRLNREFEGDRGDEAVAPHRNMFERAKRLMDTAKNRAFDVTEEPDVDPQALRRVHVRQGLRRRASPARDGREGRRGEPRRLGHAQQRARGREGARRGARPGMSRAPERPQGPRPARRDARVWFTEFGRTPRVGEGGNGPGRPRALSRRRSRSPSRAAACGRPRHRCAPIPTGWPARSAP